MTFSINSRLRLGPRRSHPLPLPDGGLFCRGRLRLRATWLVSAAVWLGVSVGCADLHKPTQSSDGTSVDDSGEDAGSRPSATVDASEPSPPSALGSLTIVSQDPSDLPVAGLDEHWDERFVSGDAAFEQIFRASQGLGPVYIRQSCASCHADDARGPGAARKMVSVSTDGITPTTDQSMFPYGHTVRPQSVDPELYPGIKEPEPFDGLLVSSRLGPAVFGRGAMEAILDSEIERLEAEQSQRTDGISGRINRVTYHSEANPESPFHSFAKGTTGLIGRFGLKSRIATLDEFAADAYQGDMGISSPMRPNELPNPANALDDDLPGLDIDLETVNLSADYVRLLRIPTRKLSAEPDGSDGPSGQQLFDKVQCSACHATGLQTDPNYPIAQWANRKVDVYTDLLLHAMGKGLADGMVEEDALGDEWRTAPLMGIRHLKSLMHDGRAKTVREAVMAHASEGSEANASVEAFTALDENEQALLLTFVQSL